MKKIKCEIKQIKVLKMTALLVFSFFLSTVTAQESVNTTGGNASGSGGTASYSVGQIVYTTNIGTNGSVAQGVHQPFEISVVIGINETNINISVMAYPNPTANYLTLSINEFEISNLSYQLYDMQGKLLESKKIVAKQTSIALGNYMPATYFVKVIDGNKEVKTFKIIKN